MKFPNPTDSSEHFSSMLEESVEMSPEQNILTIQACEHTWVSVIQENQEIVRENSSSRTISFFLSPGKYVIKSNGTIESLSYSFIEQPPPTSNYPFQPSSAILQLSSNAPDQHIVDGVGEIPADGSSFCTITIEKLSQIGESLTGEGNQDGLFLRTTGGILMDAEGQNRIRSLNLKAGRATFRLVSEASPKIVTVSVFGRETLMPKAEIQIEFV